MKRSVLRLSTGWMAEVPQAPVDSLFGLVDAFNKDPSPQKVSLGIGAYRDNEGAPYVLPSVRKAEEKILNGSFNHEYAGIDGVADFLKVSFAFCYGNKDKGSESAALNEGRIKGIQTISGTGALRVAGEFLNRFHGKGSPIYLPTPTWANHTPIFKDSGLEVKGYTYYNPSSCDLNFGGMMDDIHAAPDGSAFLLQACAHNPTGVDPTHEQWKEISNLVKTKKHVVIFDNAYQGFASGDPEADAYSIRQFVEDGHEFLTCQSYSKNFGLYGERIGALSAVCNDADEATRVASQLKLLVRPMYSNPPIFGARLVSTILSDKDLYKQWELDCKTMADRISSMRGLLKNTLEAHGSKRSWNHITDQIGMFCYTGLSKEEVLAIRDQHSVYMTMDGRVSMAGVNSSNVDYLAESMHHVTK